MKKRPSIKAQLLSEAEREADIVIASHGMAMRPTFKCLNATLPKLKLLYIIRELNIGEIDQLVREMEDALLDRLEHRYYKNTPNTIQVIPQEKRRNVTDKYGKDSGKRENFVDGFNKPAHFTNVLSRRKS